MYNDEFSTLFFTKHLYETSVAAVIGKWNTSPLYRHKRPSLTWKTKKIASNENVIDYNQPLDSIVFFWR